MLSLFKVAIQTSVSLLIKVDVSLHSVMSSKLVSEVMLTGFFTLLLGQIIVLIMGLI